MHEDDACSVPQLWVSSAAVAAIFVIYGQFMCVCAKYVVERQWHCQLRLDSTEQIFIASNCKIFIGGKEVFLNERGAKQQPKKRTFRMHETHK